MALRAKRVALWLFWGALAFFSLQLAGQLFLNQWLARNWGPGAGTFSLQLWRLHAVSPRGEGHVGETAFGWEGVDFGFFGGNLRADVAHLSFKGELLATAREIYVTELFGTPDVRVKELALEPDGPAWARLGNAWRGKEGHGDQIPSFRLWLPAITTHVGKIPLQGNALVLPSGDGYAFSGGLSSPGRGAVQMEGHRGAEGGEFFASGTLFQAKIRASATKIREKWLGELELERQGVLWQGDFATAAELPTKILLRNIREEMPSEWLFLSWEDLSRDGLLKPTIEMGPEGLTATSLSFFELPFQNRLKVTVEENYNTLTNIEKGFCVHAAVFAYPQEMRKRLPAQELLILNWRHGEGDTFSLLATLPDSAGDQLPKSLRGLVLGGELEGLFEPKQRFLGAINNDTIHLQLHGDGGEGFYEASFRAELPFSRCGGRLWWRPEGWGGEVEGAFSFPQGSPYPLPVGRWSGRANLEGKGRILHFCEMSASSVSGGALKANVHGNALNMSLSTDFGASWGTVSAFEGSARIAFSQNPFSLRGIAAEGLAKSLRAGGVSLADLSVKASGEHFLQIRSQVSLPEQQGSLQSQWILPLHTPTAVSLTEGNLSLFDERVQVEHLQAKGFFESPRQMASWSAKNITVEGETLDSPSGTLEMPAEEEVHLHGKGHLWGGEVAFEVASGREGPTLHSECRGLDAKRAEVALRRFTPLPFSVVSGKLDGAVGGPLAALGPGWAADIAPLGVTVQMPDERHQLRNLDGRLRVAVGEEGMALSSAGLTLEGGKVPLRLEGVLGERESHLLFAIPPAPASEVQNAVFDFLPEFVGYGALTGQLGLEGEFKIPEKEPLLRVRVLLPEGGGFRSEDGSLVLEGMRGALSLSVPVGEWGGSLRGYRAPGPGERAAALDRFTTPLLPGDLLRVDKIAYSVFSLRDATLSSSDGADGITRIRFTEGQLWDGLARGEFALAVDRDQIRYGGQVLLDRASLRAFCDESAGVTGFLGGRFSSAITFGADRIGLGALKAVAELEADPVGGEALLLGRDFLVKVGGNAMARLVKQEFQPYDRAVLKVGIRSGSLSVQNLVLEHRAGPFSALFKRDLSYELRMPANNSISLYHLLDLVKGLEATTTSVKTQVGGP